MEGAGALDGEDGYRVKVWFPQATIISNADRRLFELINLFEYKGKVAFLVKSLTKITGEGPSLCTPMLFIPYFQNFAILNS